MSSPCQWCDKREVGCHSKCEDYMQYNEENIKRRETIRKAREKKSARQMFMTDKMFENAGQSFNKVWKQHKK